MTSSIVMIESNSIVFYFHSLIVILWVEAMTIEYSITILWVFLYSSYTFPIDHSDFRAIKSIDWSSSLILWLESTISMIQIDSYIDWLYYSIMNYPFYPPILVFN